MFWLIRIATSFACLLLGCGLVLEFAGGQDSTFGGKAKQEKGPKGDDWGDSESKAISKVAEKATKAPETERDKWLKELNKAYPGQVSQALTETDFGQWFSLLAGRGVECRANALNRLGDCVERVRGTSRPSQLSVAWF